MECISDKIQLYSFTSLRGAYILGREVQPLAHRQTSGWLSGSKAPASWSGRTNQAHFRAGWIPHPVTFACLCWAPRKTVSISWYLFRCCLCESSVSFKGCSSVLPFSRNTLTHKLPANLNHLLVLCVVSLEMLNLAGICTCCYQPVAPSNPLGSSRMPRCASVFSAPLLNAEKCFVVLKTEEVSIEILLLMQKRQMMHYFFSWWSKKSFAMFWKIFSVLLQGWDAIEWIIQNSESALS